MDRPNTEFRLPGKLIRILGKLICLPGKLIRLLGKLFRLFGKLICLTGKLFRLLGLYTNTAKPSLASSSC